MRHIILLLAVTAASCSATESRFNCPGPGLWADPDNCQCFYNCANHIPYHECCAPGDLWDDRLKLCDYADHVDCEGRPEPGGTTDPHRTTTTYVPTTSTTKTTTTIRTTSTIETTAMDTTQPQTTDPTADTTTSHSVTSGPGVLPNKVLGIYIVLADDTEDGYHTDDDWEPALYEYQQQGANVLFFTFINPATMEVPLSFQKLANSRGSGQPGTIPADTLILFAIGGYSYSINPNPWDWLTSKSKAEAMALKVASWVDDYGIDGIDMDIEEGAGSHEEAGANIVYFVNKLRTIHPQIIVSQPTYGYPQIQAEIDVINASWDENGNSQGVADSIGIMVYEGTQALNYVKNFAEGTDQWEGFPIQVNVPRPSILVGCKGSARSADIMALADACVEQDLLGIMVWYASVVNGLQYQESWDASGSPESQQAFIEAMNIFNQHN